MLDQVAAAAIAAFGAMSQEANAASIEPIWNGLGAPAAPGPVDVAFSAIGDSITIPHCNGRAKIVVDGAVKDAGSKGSLRLEGLGPGAHDVHVGVNVSTYEKRVACAPWRSPASTVLVRFPSPHAPKPFAGEAVLFVPPGHDRNKPGALLVGIHPWNGTPWTYAAYRELYEQAEAKDVVLLMPSGLGNSLYVADAEDEVMRAIDAATAQVAIDPQRVSLWGASMGGAGATTIGFHRPDRFALVVSWFGDSKYDLSGYVRAILGSEAGAHLVNALDVIDNARHVPVWLIHGEDDKSSPVAQSVMLDAEMKRRGFEVRFDRVSGMGHEGPLIVKFIRQVVDRAAVARAPQHPSRVSFRSVRPIDTEAYGVRIVRASREGDAFVDIEKRADGIHLLAAQRVKEIVLLPGALGTSGASSGEAVHVANGLDRVNVRFAPN